MSGSRLRVALVVGTACFAVACTGTPPNQVAETPIIGESPGVGAEPADPSAVPGAEGGEAVTSPSDGTTVPGTTATPSSSTTGSTTTVGGSATGSGTTGGTSTGGGQSGTSGGGTTGGEGTGGGGGGGRGAEAQGPSEVALYDDEAKYTGITDDRVHFCGHAALIFAEAFDTRPEDLNVYWEVVNNAGGVHGRRVTASWVDDAYNPAQAVQAAEQCRSQDPFMLLGGIGFDQIPAVRNWAEQNRMLYFHHIAIAPDREYRYAYSAQPTVEAVGTAFGEHITKHHGERPVGIIWRQSENWEPGHRLGLEYLDSQGVEVVADVPVQQNQGVYNQQIAELRSSGAEVVWVWENALGAAQIIQQAHSQNYRPKWVVFPFQATLDVTGSPADPIEGVGTWSAYTPGGYGDDFSEFGYPEEIERFEAAYQQYRPRTRPNDILWQVWLGNKAMHDLLLKCGPDCNRNRFAGLLMSPYRATIAPNCAMDFGHPRSYGRHIGGHQFIVLESFRRSGGSGAYRTTRWCSEHLS